MKKIFFLALLLILEMKTYSLNYDKQPYFQVNNKAFPIHDALKKGNKESVIKLLRSGRDVNEKDLNGDTVLHLAIKKSYDDLIPLFIEYGADAKIKNDINVSSVLLAAAYKKIDILKMFLQNSDPLECDLTGALFANDMDAFNLLVNFCKNNPFGKEKILIEILYSALEKGNKEVINLCRVKNPNCMNWYINGHLPLHYAVIYSHNELVRYFIEDCQFDINSTDLHGLTPLHYAVLYGNYDLVDYLIKKKVCN